MAKKSIPNHQETLPGDEGIEPFALVRRRAPRLALDDDPADGSEGDTVIDLYSADLEEGLSPESHFMGGASEADEKTSTYEPGQLGRLVRLGSAPRRERRP